MMTTRTLIQALAASFALAGATSAQEPAAAPSPPAAPEAAAEPAAPATPAATDVAAAPAPAETPAPAAPAPAAAPTAAPAPAAAPGTATVIFFRPSRFVGSAVGFIVREGETELGKLRNAKYFVLHVTPGKHDYVVHSETKDVLTIDAEAGETYYIQGSLGMGVMVGRPNLSPSDAAAFEAAKPKLKEVAPMSEKD